MQFESNTKLLSHRARGFGHAESSYAAIKAALMSGVPYLELDTRVNSEGKLYCYHHSRINIGAAFKRLQDTSSEELNRKHVASLESVLQLAHEYMQPFQKLCIDIKDFGFEQQHLGLVNQYELMANTVFVSWIPQSLVALHRLAPGCALILSHINLAFSPLLTSIARAILGNKEIRLLDFVVMAESGAYQVLKYRVGFQHGLIVDYLHDDLVDILKASGGGICVPKFSLNERLDHWCQDNNLQQWVFTVNERKMFHDLSDKPSINVIFTDKPYQVAD